MPAISGSGRPITRRAPSSLPPGTLLPTPSIRWPSFPREEWDGYLAWLEDYEYRLLGLPRPDDVVFLDMPLDVAQTLLSARYEGDEKKKDIHERDSLYLRRCRQTAAVCR